MKLICCSRISSSGCQSRRQNCDVICLSGGISCFDLRFSYFVEYPGGLEPFLIMKKIYGFIVGRCAANSCKNTAGGAVTNKWKIDSFSTRADFGKSLPERVSLLWIAHIGALLTSPRMCAR